MEGPLSGSSLEIVQELLRQAVERERQAVERERQAVEREAKRADAESKRADEASKRADAEAARSNALVLQLSMYRAVFIVRPIIEVGLDRFVDTGASEQQTRTLQLRDFLKQRVWGSTDVVLRKWCAKVLAECPGEMRLSTDSQTLQETLWDLYGVLSAPHHGLPDIYEEAASPGFHIIDSRPTVRAAVAVVVCGLQRCGHLHATHKVFLHGDGKVRRLEGGRVL